MHETGVAKTGIELELDKPKSQMGLAAALAVLTTAGITALVGYRNHRLNTEAARITRLLGMVQGLRIAEVGAGRGTMAFRVARRLGPTGTMFATDLNPDHLSTLHDKAGKLRVRNLTVLPGSEDDCGLPPASCDGIYLRGAYHHLTNPENIAHSLLAALRPGGILLIIDFRPRLLLAPWTPKGIPGNRGGHGVREEVVIHELTSAGFRFLQAVQDWQRPLYCLMFQRPQHGARLR